MVHVFLPIQTHRKLHAFVLANLLVQIVIQRYKIIHVQIIHVRQTDFVHYQCPILHIHVFVNLITLVINVKEVSQKKKRTKLLWCWIIPFSIDIVNPCSSSPCLNQAICQDYWNTTNTWYMCVCIPPYTGTNCETSILNSCNGLCMNG